MNFIYGLIVGAFVTFVIYHWALQPILQKWRDDAIDKAKNEIGKTLGK